MDSELSSGSVSAALPEVSVLVVGYKSLDYIGRCLRGAMASARGADFEFLFIDCSNDGSEAFVREQFPKVRVLPYQGNLGFARGNNVLAAASRGHRLLLLNPDAFAQEDELSALLTLAKLHADASAWGAVTVLPSGEIDGGSIQPMLGMTPLLLALVLSHSVVVGLQVAHADVAKRKKKLVHCHPACHTQTQRTLLGIL